MKIKILLIVFFFALLFQSCTKKNEPIDYFNYTVLNLNKYLGLGFEDFNVIFDAKNNNLLYAIIDNKSQKTSSVEVYVKNKLLFTLNNDIKSLKELEVTPETEKMIKITTQLFELVKNTYETDYVKIAKMIDSNTPQAEVENAIFIMEEKRFPQFDKLHKQLLDIVLPYARKHNIDVINNINNEIVN